MQLSGFLLERPAEMSAPAEKTERLLIDTSTHHSLRRYRWRVGVQQPNPRATLKLDLEVGTPELAGDLPPRTTTLNRRVALALCTRGHADRGTSIFFLDFLLLEARFPIQAADLARQVAPIGTSLEPEQW